MTKSSTRKAAARTARPTHPKKAPRITRATYQQTTKVLAEKSHVQRRKIASKGGVEQAGTGPKLANQFEESRDNQKIFALAESGVIQTRDERSKNALPAVLESWQKSFGAAGRGVSSRMINVAGRNITATLDLATRSQRGEVELPTATGHVINVVDNHVAVGAGAVWAVTADGSVARIDAATGRRTAVVRPFAALAIATGRAGRIRSAAR